MRGATLVLNTGVAFVTLLTFNDDGALTLLLLFGNDIVDAVALRMLDVILVDVVGLALRPRPRFSAETNISLFNQFMDEREGLCNEI